MSALGQNRTSQHVRPLSALPPIAEIAGHDIGAAIAWQTALLRPGIFRAVIALSPPFRSRGFGDAGPPTTLMPRTENAVFYQLFLRTPEAEAGLGRDLRLTFRYQFSTFSGDRPPSAGVGGLPPGMMPRKGGFLIDPPSLPAWVTDSDIDVYVKEYARSGFHGPLAWWRNIDRGWELMAPFAGAAVTVPALYMAGERDFVAAVFSQDIAKQSALVPKLRPPIMLPGCGHWTQQERAAEVSTAMIDFLRSLQAEDENARWVPICVSSVSSFAKGQPSAVSPCVAGSKPGRGGATPVNVRQKQTLGKVRLMSALPPKADIASGTLRIEHRASLRVAVTESSRASIALTTLSLAGLSPCRCAVS
jgi:pimeloyl-ACP methyl ester carboxylesterase